MFGLYLYKFEDLDLKLEETKTLYQRLDEERIDKNELREKLKRTGMILILSSKVYHVRIGDRTLISEVPKKVRDLDSKLGLGLFPTT